MFIIWMDVPEMYVTNSNFKTYLKSQNSGYPVTIQNGYVSKLGSLKYRIICVELISPPKKNVPQIKCKPSLSQKKILTTPESKKVPVFHLFCVHESSNCWIMDHLNQETFPRFYLKTHRLFSSFRPWVSSLPDS